MVDRSFLTISTVAGIAAASVAFMSSAGAQGHTPSDAPVSLKEAVFAGGCFWCVESDFEKLDGVHAAISGYTGGTRDNPTYKTHHKPAPGGKAHYEAVKVLYDPAKVSYDELLEFYWRKVDPTDAGGQFCDRGDSYRTAIFVESDAQREAAEASKSMIEASGVLADPIVTPIEELQVFYPAEDYHQDYYIKNPIRYRIYRSNCGRDRRIKDVWSQELPGS